MSSTSASRPCITTWASCGRSVWCASGRMAGGTRCVGKRLPSCPDCFIRRSAEPCPGFIGLELGVVRGTGSRPSQVISDSINVEPGRRLQARYLLRLSEKSSWTACPGSYSGAIMLPTAQRHGGGRISLDELAFRVLRAAVALVGVAAGLVLAAALQAA